MRDNLGRPVSAREAEIIRAITAEKRKPTDADRPPLSTFADKPVKPTPGQLDVFGGEVDGR